MWRLVPSVALICWTTAIAAQPAPDVSSRPVARADLGSGGASVSVPEGAGAPPIAQQPFVQPSVLSEFRPRARDPRRMRPLSLAVAAMEDQRWGDALALAQGDGAIALDYVRWVRLRAGAGTQEDLFDFLGRNGDWPGLPYLKENSEHLLVDAPRDFILAFFKDYAPRKGIGALALAGALEEMGDVERTREVVRAAWVTLALEEEEQAAFLNLYGGLIEELHWARLDAGLWKGWTSNPLRMKPLVSSDRWQLAEARMALRAGGAAGDVPEALTDDPGLAFEAFRKLKGAAKRRALLAQSTSAEALGKPEAWASARRPMARDLMRDGQFKAAYQVASQHFTKSGRDFADLEWLSGYLSLKLNEPERALEHFKRFRNDVFTPISLGRAGYWEGRAYEALGKSDAAVAAYTFAAQYQTSFYGLLAAERAGIPFPEALGGIIPQGDWRAASFTASSVHKAAVLLLASGQDWPAERFWTHLAERQDSEQIALMGQMLADLDQPHIQVMLGKRAASAGLEIAAPYYALPSFARQTWPVPNELVLAIARRESEFDPGVISHAGARGLMQLMPGTAQDVSGDLGVPYSKDRLLSDPAYNARLGSEYLRQMAVRYRGNPVLMSVAYNAGPARADRWETRFGNPRSRTVDIVDWIESIPFRETRNYVMRVTESLPVYRARLGREALPVPFSQELKGSGLLLGAP